MDKVKEIFKQCFEDGRNDHKYNGKRLFRDFSEWWHCNKDEATHLASDGNKQQTSDSGLNIPCVSKCECGETKELIIICDNCLDEHVRKGS